MVKKIALEEHFLDPATEPYWRPTMVDVAPAQDGTALCKPDRFRRTAAGHDGQDRHLAGGPVDRRSGVQVERDTATAIRNARASNDFLAKEVQKRPDRYSGFAHLAMQDAKAAADELERCVRELKFCGAMINGHTNGKYLDDRSYDPFWERAAAFGAPIYLHPADPVAQPCRRLPATTCWRGRCGAGALKPARTRCASSAAVSFTVIRKPSSCSAIWVRLCRSSSGASTAARRPMAGTCRSRRRNISRKTSG